jgi:hypothetical protein
MKPPDYDEPDDDDDNDSDQEGLKKKKSDHSKYVYFQPGEVIFVLTHTGAALSEDDFNALIAWSNEKASANANGLSVQPRPGEELLSFPAFPAPNQDQQGQYYLQQPPQPSLGGQNGAPRPELLEPHGPFTIVLADVKDKINPASYVRSTRLATFITQLDGSIQSDLNTGKLSLSPGTVLEVASPNWLSSPSSETGGGGGPGSRPVPFRGKNPPQKSQYEFHLPQKILDHCPPFEERGKDVVVAILDTAPCMHNLVAAYERWQKVDPRPNPADNYPGNPPEPHGLIESLLEPKPDGHLTVHYASYEELIRMRSVHLRDHNYDMTDHGLFVAGIIHSIAPAAEIHLYEVLNPEGVGDLKSIATGLWKVLKLVESLSFPTKRLVVNCSLVLNIPLLYQPITDLAKDLKAKFIHDWPKHKAKADTIDTLSKDLWTDEESLAWLSRQARAIERICNLIYERYSRVVAAAGNDRALVQPPPEKPQARYPAAFESVVGVGALKRRPHVDPVDAAEYSDRADRPEKIGITTLGGEKYEKNGVLGVYIGKFPRPERKDNESDGEENESNAKDNGTAPENQCDWAWWAGTSFAAPIITGVTAAVLSGNLGWKTEDAIEALYKSQAITLGPFGEDVLDVTQGS